MTVSRGLYITFQMLYLITLTIALWFLLYYSGVPAWVWILFALAMLFYIISIIIEETALWSFKTCEDGRVIVTHTMGFWAVMDIILNIMAFLLIIVGLIFVIIYSTIPWWVWVILGASILFGLLANLFGAIGLGLLGLIFVITSLVMYILAIIFIIVYSHAPWWVWLIIGAAIFFAILAAIFKSLSPRKPTVIEKPCPLPKSSGKKALSDIAEINVLIPPTNISDLSTNISDIPTNISDLPTANIPEQNIVIV